MSRRNVDTATSSGLYESPTWPWVSIMQRLRDVLPLGRWLEPTCGKGQIILAVERVLRPAAWVGVELTEEHAATARRRTRAEIVTGDALQVVPTLGRFDVAVSNHPFPEALELVLATLPTCDWVINLQRFDWMEGASQETPRYQRLFSVDPPDLYALPNRPKFRGKLDSGGYGFYVWPPERRRPHGRLFWLPSVPRSLRAEHRLQLGMDVE